MTCHFQYSLPADEVLGTSEFGGGLREAMRRDDARVPKLVDGLLVFDEPRQGFRAIVVEAKSGTLEPDAAVYQLKAYRPALKARFPGRYLIVGAVEKPRPPGAPPALDGEDDVWVFCDADRLPERLGQAGGASGASGRAMTRHRPPGEAWLRRISRGADCDLVARNHAPPAKSGGPRGRCSISPRPPPPDRSH